MYKILCLFCAFLVFGCASHTGIVSISNNTYMIAKQQATGFPGLGNMKAEIISEGNSFCKADNKEFKLLSTNETKGPYVWGNYPRSEITFTCTIVAGGSTVPLSKMPPSTDNKSPQAIDQITQNVKHDTDANRAVGTARRFALVIGNSNYSSVSVLPNATNDSREVAKALQSSGFEVTKLDNADLRQMQDAVRNFGNRLGRNDVGLFYFAGHGVQVKGKNYLIPIRENIKNSFEVPSSSLDADLVLATMENAKNNLNIMILDACRAPFPGESRSLSRGLATLDAAKGTLIAFASAPGKEALDGQGNNSPYTKNLVQALQQKGLSIEQVFKQVRIAVVEETKGAQVPWENSSIMGDFFFRR
jgi:hypothetical protein